jgi:hypothetical protein
MMLHNGAFSKVSYTYKSKQTGVGHLSTTLVQV